MLSGGKNTFHFNRLALRSAAVTLTAMGTGQIVALADDVPKKLGNDISQSIENILQQASEKGFVDIISEDDGQDRSVEPEEAEILVEPLSAYEPNEANCDIADVLDLTSFQGVSHYTDIVSTKSKLTSLGSLDARLPLIKTYWSLGFGTETIALVQPFNDERAPLLTAIGKTLSGETSEYNNLIVQKYAHCNDHAELWFKVVGFDDQYAETNENRQLPDDDDIETLNEYPERLRAILTRRLGIIAAESGNTGLARKMLFSIEPDVKKGRFPNARDDETMYFFALLEVSRKAEKGRKILEKLSQFDGPVRTKALSQLSKHYADNGRLPYSGYYDDLQSVSQQYNGKKAGRQASVQTIKLLLENGAAIESIKLATQELDVVDPKRIEVVSLIADHILSGLQNNENKRRLNALNAYLFDRGFFQPLETHSELKFAALAAALALNMPELEAYIYSPEEAENLNSEASRTLAIARLKSAHKKGDLKALKDQMEPFADDPEFQSLYIEALVDAGQTDEAIMIVDAALGGPDTFVKKANIEWRLGDFAAAYSTLKTLDYVTGGSQDDTNLKLAGFLTFGEQSYTDLNVPKTAAGLDELQSEVSTDINIVKAYLTNG